MMPFKVYLVRFAATHKTDKHVIALNLADAIIGNEDAFFVEEIANVFFSMAVVDWLATHKATDLEKS